MMHLIFSKLLLQDICFFAHGLEHSTPSFQTREEYIELLNLDLLMAIYLHVNQLILFGPFFWVCTLNFPFWGRNCKKNVMKLSSSDIHTNRNMEKLFCRTRVILACENFSPTPDSFLVAPIFLFIISSLLCVFPIFSHKALVFATDIFFSVFFLTGDSLGWRLFAFYVSLFG